MQSEHGAGRHRDEIVTKFFGAFVDIGVDQDGVHVSELSARYVKDTRRQWSRPGQIVKVKVLSADPRDRDAIAPSIKALELLPPNPSLGAAPRHAPPTMNDKLAALSSKWKTR